MDRRTIYLSVCGEASRPFAVGTPVRDALSGCTADSPLVAGFVNNQIRALSYRLPISAEIRPIHLNDAVGMLVYRRSLSYLLAMASNRVFPERRLRISHSLGNALLYSYADQETDQKDLRLLEEEMRGLVESDLPIDRGSAAYGEALDHFRSNGRVLTALLVEGQNYSEVPVYRCGEFMDLSHGPVVDRTGLLRVFSLQLFEEGFLLVFPSRRSLDRPDPGSPSRILYETYREHKNWGRILRVSSVGELAQITERDEIDEFIRVAESLHSRKIARIADAVHGRRADVRVVLIAGPSSSGKTTFTKRLAVQLRVLGISPVMLSLDDYFVPREHTPLDEEGKPDFESVHAIDLDLLNDNLERVIAGKEVEIPSFNFKTGLPEFKGHRLRIPDQGVLLIEGIHGLNPVLTHRIAEDRKFKVYVSALTQLNLDDHNRIATTDNRLIRRIVRDHQFRGHSAATTLRMWPGVRRGEDRNIFPYQDSADLVFNSALDYELGVLKGFVEPLLRQIKPYDDIYHEAFRLIRFLRNFAGIREKSVPDDSILREFIGDSGFHY